MYLVDIMRAEDVNNESDTNISWCSLACYGAMMLLPCGETSDLALLRFCSKLTLWNLPLPGMDTGSECSFSFAAVCRLTFCMYIYRQIDIAVFMEVHLH